MCYTQAIPFYRWMLHGDLLYVAVVFGGYAFAVQREWLPKRVFALARS